ncbi:hypothetical protein, partial [Anaerostipes caccae]|uniref:hypothetical protein n=1 Tax=Anaerostipes caccae TaxID=105841 RepID=UPI0039931B38
CFVSNVDNLIIAAGKCQQFFLLFSHIILRRNTQVKNPKEKALGKCPVIKAFQRLSLKFKKASHPLTL